MTFGLKNMMPEQYNEPGKICDIHHFFYYYVPKRYSGPCHPTQESLRYRERIWNFKHGVSQQNIVEMLIKKIPEIWPMSKDLTLVCIPASNKLENAKRYESFSRKICQALGMQNGFDHVEVLEDGEASHLGGKKKAEIFLDPVFFDQKKILIFDDVVTTGHSMNEMRVRLEALGASVVGFLSLGRTYSYYYSPETLDHPWTLEPVFEERRAENVSRTDPDDYFEAMPQTSLEIDREENCPSIVDFSQEQVSESKGRGTAFGPLIEPSRIESPAESESSAKTNAVWAELEEAFESGKPVSGTVVDEVNGGFTVEIDGIEAFLPYSLLDLHFVSDASSYMWETYDFKVIELERERENVVISRRAVLEAEAAEKRGKLLETLKEGMVVKGVVKNLTDFGAFVDLGGIDGLIHISDLAWRRVRRPGDVVKVGQELEAKVLKFDREKPRISLGLKQLAEDPWTGISSRCPKGMRLFGKVMKITDFGAFVEVEPGIEGLVHVSEMGRGSRNANPRELVQKGATVEVMVLETDEARRRISLGMRQCRANP